MPDQALDEEMTEPWCVYIPSSQSRAVWTDAIAIAIANPLDDPNYPRTIICWFTRGWNSKIAAQAICDWHNRSLQHG